MLRWMPVKLGRAVWGCCKRHYPQSAMCIQKHMHHAQSDGCPQYLKCSPRTTLTPFLLPGKWWTLSPKDEVEVKSFSLLDQQTVPNHSCSCHWASCLTASSVHQTLSFTLSQLLIKRSFYSTICGMVVMARGDDRFLPWNQFLNLLEGASVNVAMPKNAYASGQE